jgi:hypothetical protein
MNTERIVSDFKQRKLHIDFHELTLVQNKPGIKGISYKGKGYIRQTDEDILTFKLYSNETHNTNWADNFNRHNRIEAGKLYSEDSYYKLTGVAVDRTVWSAERILPKSTWNVGQDDNPILHGDISTVMVGDKPPESRSITMHFFEKASLPIMISEVKFVAVKCEFHIESLDDGFVVRAISEKPHPAHFAMRIEEALRFLLARNVVPRAIVRHRSLELTSTTLKSPTVRMWPPISRGSAAFHGRSWDLFEKYLAFITTKTKHENWNPITGYLYMAHQSSANSLDAWAMGLGVAVEGLASQVNIVRDKATRKKHTVEQERLKQLQVFIPKQVSKRKRFVFYSKRIEGLVSGLTTERPVDRMKWLATIGKVESSHVKAWQKLRNRAVHPATNGEFDVASIDFQNMLDELFRVNVLLYHIVFHVIDYHGPYTDYSITSFPEKEYPLAGIPKV